MSEQDGTQSSIIQRPTSDDKEAWKAYWIERGQPWRTEPEIDGERQKFLAERRSISPDIKQGIYPFKDIKLSRADVEWLLATHENGRGPIDWSDESQREREGLDLRGADLCKVDLCRLPLTGLRGGLKEDELLEAKDDSSALPVFKIAPLYMEETHLDFARLEGANLNSVQLKRASLTQAQLEDASLYGAQLEQANLFRVQLKGAYLFGADLKGASLNHAHLEGANLKFTHLEEVKFCGARLGKTNLSFAHLERVDFRDALLGDNHHVGPLLADVQWSNTNLTVIDWSQVALLGDENQARQKKDSKGKIKGKQTRLSEYKQAVRANRQLSVVLRDQGLNEEADRFAYQAQQLQRKVLWNQHEYGHWLFSMLLAILSGYGYRIWRILATYAVAVLLFALAYFFFGIFYPPHIPLIQALLESITAFHGRVFFEQFSPNTPQIWFTAFEAIGGLIIEGVFIAMLIQRFFNK